MKNSHNFTYDFRAFCNIVQQVELRNMFYVFKLARSVGQAILLFWGTQNQGRASLLHHLGQGCALPGDTFHKLCLGRSLEFIPSLEKAGLGWNDFGCAGMF